MQTPYKHLNDALAEQPLADFDSEACATENFDDFLRIINVRLGPLSQYNYNFEVR